MHLKKKSVSLTYNQQHVLVEDEGKIELERVLCVCLREEERDERGR